MTANALDMALKRRGPDSRLLHHSDQGRPYASDDYRTILKAHHMTCSMSRRGDRYGNAVMEAFFSTVTLNCANNSPAATKRSGNCSSTLNCSISSGADTR